MSKMAKMANAHAEDDDADVVSGNSIEKNEVFRERSDVRALTTTVDFFLSHTKFSHGIVGCVAFTRVWNANFGDVHHVSML